MTRIADLLAKGRTYSFEFFPPKTDAEQATLVKTLRDLEPLDPSFVSVTYRGGAESRQRTFDLVTGMLRTTTLVPMAHLICVAHTRLELAEILVAYRTAGVENLMALGGDPPTDGEGPGELTHAAELVELASAIGGFSIGVAAHPAGHPRSPDRRSDRDHLAAKLELADFAVTQFFFEVEEYTGLVADLAARGVDKPVLPGIMPVTSLASVPRRAAMGAAVPTWMVDRLVAADARGGADAVRHEGVAIATELCRQLLEADAPGLHFYTLNRSSATREIYSALGLDAP
jgi:methylenetetrahydrofolate reductase (NADPH)